MRTHPDPGKPAARITANATRARRRPIATCSGRASQAGSSGRTSYMAPSGIWRIAVELTSRADVPAKATASRGADQAIRELPVDADMDRKLREQVRNAHQAERVRLPSRELGDRPAAERRAVMATSTPSAVSRGSTSTQFRPASTEAQKERAWSRAARPPGPLPLPRWPRRTGVRRRPRPHLPPSSDRPSAHRIACRAMSPPAATRVLASARRCRC